MSSKASKKVRIYSYPKCSTCRDALRFLQAHEIAHDVRDIIETPPSVPELECALRALGDRKKLFNTSGQQYRELGIAEKLKSMTDSEALALLSRTGKLVKRPFVLIERGKDSVPVLVGFKEDEWKQALLD
ncbi:MAG: arsenate reductase family protein [Bdellovibrionaceae bacterium]|nr:arsenate reductase family protein [Pseudobdellovibrionaceae bacterium]